MYERSAVYRIDDQTVAIVEDPFEADDHGIEHATVSPITFIGRSEHNPNDVPISKAPKHLKQKVLEAHARLSINTVNPKNI